jgi:hypothetical protein
MTSLRPFFTGIVDYAGLFPPAKLDMSAAVHAYAKYREGPDGDLLGNFVVGVGRLDELSACASALLPRDADPWKVSVIAPIDNLTHSRSAIDHFNAIHSVQSKSGHAVCDTIELPVSSHDDIRNAVAIFADDLSTFLEVPTRSDPAYLIAEIAETPASAKIRTGGTVGSAIPAPEHVLRFIRECVDKGVPFKATAGLHHAIRGRYPLTYEPNAPTGMMFGYLNVFFAAAFCAAGSSVSAVLGVLEETDPHAFRSDATGIWWKDHVVVEQQLTVVRQAVATSFGSCSFTEPVAEARDLNLI